MHWPVTSNPTGHRQPANFPYLLSTKLRSHNKLAILNEASGAVYSLFAFGRSAASGLPCAGAAPPQRPPPKPSLTDPVCAFQQCRSTNLGCRQPNTQSDSLNGGSDKELVKAGTVSGLAVTFPLFTDHCRYICCEISVSFAVINSSSTGTPSSVFWMPRSIAGMIWSGVSILSP